MQLLRILKKSKGGTYYIELSSDLVNYLEWAVGDTLAIDGEEVWVYSRAKKTCTLQNITQQKYDRLIDLINCVGPENEAPNRE
tara:strand:- start:2426 stop:2674 length:249 start_codon:yes stop_codon:yes gene_type:complete